MNHFIKLSEELSRDYYKGFIKSIDEESIDMNVYGIEIIRDGKYYYEMFPNLIKIEIDKIINLIKPIYYDSIREVIEIINKPIKIEEKRTTFLNAIRVFEFISSVLSRDILIDKKSSRYYSEFEWSHGRDLNNDLLSNIIENSNLFDYNPFLNIEENRCSDDVGLDIFFYNLRVSMLSYLPTALYTLSKTYLNFLNSNIPNSELENENYSEYKINWEGKPSHLGYIFGVLADLEYIDAPKKKDGEINYTKFAKEVLGSLNVKTKESTLSKYLNISTEKSLETSRKFETSGFFIPHKKEVS